MVRGWREGTGVKDGRPISEARWCITMEDDGNVGRELYTYW
jgi:hypothetical protein